MSELTILKRRLALLFAVAVASGAVLGYILNPVFDAPVYDLEFQKIAQAHVESSRVSGSYVVVDDPDDCEGFLIRSVPECYGDE